MMAREAALLFLDEPFNGVDTTTQDRILELLEAERVAGKGILMVTHDLEAAKNWCSHILLVNQTVLAAGQPNCRNRATKVATQGANSACCCTHWRLCAAAASACGAKACKAAKGST